MSRRLRILVRIAKRLKREKGPLDTPCWVWTGPTSGDGRGGGYGRISLDGVTMAVHRVMWMIINGPISPKKQLDHECENRLCANPAHLHPVTQKQHAKRQSRR